MTQKITVKNWAEADRPREKLVQKGVNSLSDAELLAILLRCGNSDYSSVELSRKILDSVNNDLNELGKQSVHQLMSEYKGIGLAKAVTIIAALELGKRRNAPLQLAKTRILGSKDIYAIFHSLLCDLPNEEFWVLLLNRNNKIMHKIKISQGGISATIVDNRILFREAIIRSATSIVLCHNHPSGNPNPSIQDDSLTEQIRDGAKLFNLSLLDHIIISDRCYYSYADEGKL